MKKSAHQLMVRLGVLYNPNHGSSQCEQTMKIEITEGRRFNPY